MSATIPDLPLENNGFPVPPPGAPQVKSWWRRPFGILLMRLSGWRIAGNLPNIPKFVMIVAPHTSNWDFLRGILPYCVLRLDTTWFAKHTAFAWPFGIIARHFGGMPIDRTKGGNIVRTCVAEFARRERMAITITPEGTRKKVKEWKLGFYYIAKEAGVPVLPVALNYPKKLVMIMPPYYPTGDADADLAAIKAMYSKEMARYPENF
jgi:1-acyl-sn-glycerol-3-phosphate acyltransferase